MMYRTNALYQQGQGALQKTLSRPQRAPAEEIVSVPIASLPWKR